MKGKSVFLDDDFIDALISRLEKYPFVGLKNDLFIRNDDKGMKIFVVSLYLVIPINDWWI